MSLVRRIKSRLWHGIAINALYDRQTVRIFRKVLRPDDVAIDIGANEGTILAHLVGIAPNGRHHAFEPIPQYAAILRDRFPSVTVHELALSNEKGRAEFHHVTTNSGYSGLRKRRYDRPGERVELIEVAVDRLDDVLPYGTDPRMIKIDVEGGELGVLQGARELLGRCKPYVVFEHGLGAADFYGTGPDDVYALFADAGMSVSLLGRWLKGRPPLSQAEFADEFFSGRNYYFLAYASDS